MYDDGMVKILTVSDALPDIDATSSRVPDSALTVHCPVYVELPDSCSVGNNGHGVVGG